MNNHFDINYPYIFNLTPLSSTCHEFIENNSRHKKSILLVPHVIKHKELSEIITWRCNWGSICDSECCYSLTKIKDLQTPYLHESQEMFEQIR